MNRYLYFAFVGLLISWSASKFFPLGANCAEWWLFMIIGAIINALLYINSLEEN